MKTVFPAYAGVLLLIGFLQPAQAEEVRCESINDGQAECRINTDGEVRLVRQLSKADCDEGRTWGVGYDEVWVTGGCRAIFESSGGDSALDADETTSGLPNRVTCESINNQYAECEMDTRGEVRLVRQLSNADCDYGSSWGANQQSIWVTDGCRGIFESEGAKPASPQR